MIWFWIIMAIIFSLCFCKRKIGWYHYIWILLPIEMYGVSLFGATIKPYMIMGIFIILVAILKKRALKKIPVSFIGIIMLLFISDSLTGMKLSSIMQHIMFAFILFIALCYKSIQKNGIDFEQIGYITTATTIGYGIVFLIAKILYLKGIYISGLLARERFESGMFMCFISTGGISSFRFRGFCIDPNAVVTTLIPGAAFSLANLFYRRKDKFRSIMAVSLFLNVVISSGSRMGFICTVIMFVCAFGIGYQRTINKKKWLIYGSIILVMIAFYLGINFTLIANKINSFFQARAAITSEYGRITIWKKNLLYLFEDWRFVFGVGQNQIHLMSVTGLSCHNTWLEWICGTGIIIGSIINFWIFFAPIHFLRKIKYLNRKVIDRVLPFIISYLIILICITTIDNITNSIMLFLVVIFRYGYIKEFKTKFLLKSSKFIKN